MSDNINPAHYKSGDIECIDTIRAALTDDEFRGYCKGNAIKYIYRERMKGGNESLQKANWYMDKAVSVSSQPAAVEGHWYPGNGVGWVEVVPGTGMPKELFGDEMIEILVDSERNRKEWKSVIGPAASNPWTSIVAYKKVKQ